MNFDAADITRLYGRHAADLIVECKRLVALADRDAKLAAFREALLTLSQASTDQWLPKDRAVDLAEDIAVAHDLFGCPRAEVQQMIADAFTTSLVPVPSTFPISRRQLIMRRASELEPERLDWIWPGRIAKGKLVLIGGPPGLGKSLLTVFVAATISKGREWPCDEGRAPIGGTIILSAEDGARDTIVPRLMAADADMQRVHIVEAKLDGKSRKTFSLKADVDLLEERIKTIGDIRMVIVDPISAYLGGSDGNNNVETRDALEPLAEMANRLGVAVLAITHLNKTGGAGRLALNRFAGSIAFVAAARAVFAVIEDHEHPERRLLLQGKNNLAAPCKGLAFRIEQRLIAGDILSSNIFFESDHVSVTFGDALAAAESSEHEPSTTDDAEEFLREMLASGPVEVLEIEGQARAAGLLADSKRLADSKPFRSARKRLGIRPHRIGFGPGARHVLELPTIMDAQKADGCRS